MGANVLATIVIGERHQKIFELTKKYIFEYAKKIGADLAIYNEDSYLIIDQSSNEIEIYKHKSNDIVVDFVDMPFYDGAEHAYDETWRTNAFKKLRIVELLQKYQRVCFIDCDILIKKDSPNIFNIVPVEKVGMYNESQFFEHFKEDVMQDWCEKFNIDYSRWNGAHYNSGVTVFSRGHELLYKKPKFLYKDMFYDQTHLNGNILEYNIPMYDLPYQFNRVFFIDEVVPDSRYESFFIHYAGSWHLLDEGHSKNPEYLLSVIKHDIDVLNGVLPMPDIKKSKNGSSDRWWSI